MYGALNIEFNSEHRFVISRPEGVVDDYSAMLLMNFLLALERVAEPFNRVADLTNAIDICVSSAAIREYAETRLQNLAHLAPFRAAIIAPSPLAEAAGHLCDAHERIQSRRWCVSQRTFGCRMAEGPRGCPPDTEPRPKRR